MAAPQKTIIIIAGPNGAGKTTLADEFLPNEAGCLPFINADQIAERLDPVQPECAAVAAGRVMLDMIRRYVSEGRSFAFETTLSGRTYASMIPRWREQGYQVRLYFLRLPSLEVAIARVHQRVSTGGHSVPDDVIRRRFGAGLRNFETIYQDMADEWKLYDSTDLIPVEIARSSDHDHIV